MLNSVFSNEDEVDSYLSGRTDNELAEDLLTSAQSMLTVAEHILLITNPDALQELLTINSMAMIEAANRLGKVIQ